MIRVFLIASMSLDGYISQEKNQSSLKWTSKEDTAFFVERTKAAGVVIMGSVTFATIGRPLKDRLVVVCTRSQEKQAALRTEFDQAQVWATTLEPGDLLRELEKQGYHEVALCGGAQLYTTFMQAGLIDELYLTVEPVLLGNGIRLFSNIVSTKLHLKEVIDLSKQVKVLHYQVLERATA